MIVNQQNIDRLFTGYSAAFKAGQSRVEPKTDLIATRVPSVTAENLYPWLGQFPRLREWVGDRVLKDMSAYGWTVRNKSFEATVEVDRDEIEDDQYGIYTPIVEEMGYSSSIHPDELLWPLLAGGFNTPCYDGQYFFDTDHPVGSGTVSNYQAGSSSSPWYLMNTQRVIKPMLFQQRRAPTLQQMTRADDEAVFMRKKFRFGVDWRGQMAYGLWQLALGSKATLDESNFNLARQQMMGFVSDEGRPLGVSPNLLVVGVSNMALAEKLIMSRTLANGADNTLYKVVDVYVCPWLP